ncbi:hypothetical protein B2J88_46850 [Rhodococcus sp. SRB_17]|nr:hypothetical protein [Rhodococcus sp. SRB_17]
MVGHSASWRQFQENWATIDHLVGLRQGTRSVSRAERAALNQAAMVFMVTMWEAYAEDVSKEIAGHIALYAGTFKDLPKRLRSVISSGVTSKPPKWLPADIADHGWEDILRLNARKLAGKVNTPSAVNVDSLIHDATGYESISATWQWQGMRPSRAAELLEEAIQTRHEIVHTGRKPDRLNANWIKAYGNNIRQVVNKTDSVLFEYGNSFGTMIDFTRADISQAQQWLAEEVGQADE